MSDIKDNSFVGITAMAQPDGTIKAIEVHVFAEPLRGTGEGQYTVLVVGRDGISLPMWPRSRFAGRPRATT
jgi:hypothetical protein